MPYIHNVQHAMVSGPGVANINLPFTPMPIVTSVLLTTSSLPTKHFGAQSLQPFSLRPAVLLVLRLISGLLPMIQGLATRWLASLPGRASHPLECTTLPGRTKPRQNPDTLITYNEMPGRLSTVKPSGQCYISLNPLKNPCKTTHQSIGLELHS